MVQKFMSVVLHFGILSVKILLKLIKFRRTLLLINASALCPILLVSKSFVMPSKKYSFFVFLLQGVGKILYSCTLYMLVWSFNYLTVYFILSDFSKPLWEIISHMVSHVTLPTPGKNRVLFSIENCLLSAEAPPKEWLPHADVQFLFPFVLWYIDTSNLVFSIIPLLK